MLGTPKERPRRSGVFPSHTSISSASAVPALLASAHLAEFGVAAALLGGVLLAEISFPALTATLLLLTTSLVLPALLLLTGPLSALLLLTGLLLTALLLLARLLPALLLLVSLLVHHHSPAIQPHARQRRVLGGCSSPAEVSLAGSVI
jgi:hypothetical protein